MKKTNKPSGESLEKRPKRVSAPGPYVDVNDLRAMLKLGLGLHGMSQPRAKLEKAMGGLLRLTGSDTWVAAVISESSPRMQRATADPIVLHGGNVAEIASAAAERIVAGLGNEASSIRNVLDQPSTPGRVLAVIEKDDGGGSAIYSIVRPEMDEPSAGRTTWISVHRSAVVGPFLERERRMVELFHSQSAWLLLQMAG